MQFRQIILFVGFCFSASYIFAMDCQEQNNQTDNILMRQFSALNNCVLKCNQCVTACLNHQEHHGHAMDCAPICMDCADVCAMASQFTARNSSLSPHVNELAVMAAQKCFQKCSTEDDESCQACAQACSSLIALCTESLRAKK